MSPIKKNSNCASVCAILLLLLLCLPCSAASPGGAFSPTGSQSDARTVATATLLPNGTVLLAGGYNPPASLASAEIYDPDTGLFSSTGSMSTGRAFHSATLLPNGKVLIAGGWLGGSN